MAEHDPLVPIRRRLARSRLLEASDAWRRGRRKEALQRSEESVLLDPALAEAHTVAAKLRFWSGDLAGSRESVDRAAAAGLDRGRVEAMVRCLDRADAWCEQEAYRERSDREVWSHWSARWAGWCRDVGAAVGRLRGARARAGLAFLATVVAVCLAWWRFG
jgi:hypothetical protein